MAKKGKPKATRAAKENRVFVVQELLLDGRTRSFILRYGEVNWKLSTRQMDEYIRLATLEIEEANLGSAERNLALITGNLWDLVRENRIDTPNVSRQALMDIAKLRGLDQVDINLHIERPLKDVSDDELAAAAAGANT